jgi:(1->4)-alpha-D-glucan 1-alpha-D-glucosylmutase
MTERRVPLATYRVQFHGGTGFDDAADLVDHLDRLGVDTLYASPILQARPGSSHGYDIVDPSRLSDELGGLEAFQRLSEALRSRRMGLLLDVVPNHMAASPHNPWWREVLEHGPAAPHAPAFDIEWRPLDSGTQPQVLLPVLGRPEREVLQEHELHLDVAREGLQIRYHGQSFPLDPHSYQPVLEDAAARLAESDSGEEARSALAELVRLARDLPPRVPETVDQADERLRRGQALKDRLWVLYHGDAHVRRALDASLRAAETSNGEAPLVERLLQDQAYRLAYWREALPRLNYRRFFDISDLVALHTDSPGLVEATHALTFRLIEEGKASALRVDHIDGLRDPQAYLHFLRQRLPSTCYLIVEKVLIGSERLPDDWPVDGSTGYDFLNRCTGLFVDPAGLERLCKTYAAFTGRKARFSDVMYQQKKLVLEQLFAAEVRALAERLGRLARDQPKPLVLPHEIWRRAVIEVTAGLSVYRTYLRALRVPEPDRRRLDGALRSVQRRNKDLPIDALAFLGRVLLLLLPPQAPPATADRWLRWVMRWQQLSGPAMAKGLEDSALYLHHPLASLNEVGGEPSTGAVDVETMHRFLIDRHARWPHSLNATTTHDTKRGEDARARISAVSELVDSWTEAVERWHRLNRSRRRQVYGRPVPDDNEEYLLYQTLVGAWPYDETEHAELVPRLQTYVVKAAREARVHTSWLDPDETYETGLRDFLEEILDPNRASDFLNDFRTFEQRIAEIGCVNALGQLVVKTCAPGVPDFYQGTETWTQSLVDPDNRRPVDWRQRRGLLDALDAANNGEGSGGAAELARSWRDGRLKAHVTRRLLHLRRRAPDAMRDGTYQPVYATPGWDHRAFSFVRRGEHTWVLAVVPRLVASLRRGPDGLPDPAAYGDAALVLPEGAPTHWRDALADRELQTVPIGSESGLRLSDVFSVLPVGVLEAAAPRLPLPVERA